MLKRILFEFLYLMRQTPWDTQKTPPELLFYLNSHPPQAALELGCGTGTNAIIMARSGWDVTGVDFSQLAIAQAKRRASAASLSIRFLQQDATYLKNVHGPFALILDIGCFHSVTEKSRMRYLQQIDALLSPEGTFLLYTHLSSANDRARLLPTIDDLREQLEGSCYLAHVEHGTDRGGRQPSAWLTFQRQPV